MMYCRENGREREEQKEKEPERQHGVEQRRQPGKVEERQEQKKEGWQEPGEQGEELIAERSKTKPGDVHEDWFREFWESLKPGSWVLSVLEKGYEIPFKGESPGPYEEANNASAKKHLDFVREQVRKLEQRGVVRWQESKPICTNPLTVATKVIEGGKLKQRLCLDLSRHVNPMVKHEVSKLSTFKTALSLILPGDFQGVYDLASAYHHIRMGAQTTQYLGFNVPDQEGKEHFYVFCRLPFGLCTAGQVLDRVLKPVCAHIAAHGIRHSIYIDDGHVSAETKEGARAALEVVYRALERTGFKLATDKSDTGFTVAQTKEYLGFCIDAQKMQVYAPKRKMDQIKEMIATELKMEREGQWRKVKGLALLAGKVIAIEPAIGPAAQLLTSVICSCYCYYCDRTISERHTESADEQLGTPEKLRRLPFNSYVD